MDNKEKLKNWIYENQHQMELMSRNICKNEMWDDLRSETLISIEKNKYIPENIIEEGKEFYYLYGVMNRIFISNSTKFHIKYSFQGFDEKDSEIESIDEVYDFDQEERVDIVYQILKKLIKHKNINLYDAKCFILYYFPQYSTIWVPLSMEDYVYINEKSSWRRIGKVLGINYQSLRLSSIKVLEKIKNKI